MSRIRLPCKVGPTAELLAYPRTKKQKTGYALSREISGPNWEPRGIKVKP